MFYLPHCGFCLAEMGIRDQVSTFLKAAYTNLSCEVKVGMELSEPLQCHVDLGKGVSSLPVVLLVHQLAGN